MDLSSKFSLYDVLAMIIPGSIVVANLALCFNVEWGYLHEGCCGTIIIFDDWNLLQGFIFLIVSYIVGLIVNWISDGVFHAFRNNPHAISNELSKVAITNRNINLWRIGVVDSRSIDKMDIKRLLPLYFLILKEIILSLKPSSHLSSKDIVILYYKTYYLLIKNKLLGNIPLIEAQVSLLRNLILPLIMTVIILFTSHHLSSYIESKRIVISIIIAIIVFLISIVMVQRQNKIYNLVWDAANYNKL